MSFIIDTILKNIVGAHYFKKTPEVKNLVKSKTLTYAAAIYKVYPA